MHAETMERRACSMPSERSRDGQSELAIDARDLARRLGISVRHLRRMIENGDLGPRCLRFGRAVRFSVVEVCAWLDAGAPNRTTWEALTNSSMGDGAKTRRDSS